MAHRRRQEPLPRRAQERVVQPRRRECVPEPSVEDEVFADEPGEVMQAVLHLPEKYKDVVFLHYVEGRKTDEIARMLGSPPSTVRNRLADARALLRKELEGGGGI